MSPRSTPVLSLLLLVPLLARAAPADVPSHLSLLAPVTLSGYQGDEGPGLKLTFQALGPDPALALLTLEDARAVVAALEGNSRRPASGPLHRRRHRPTWQR